MKLNPLGKSQLMVSRLCLGTMMFGDQTDAAEAGRIVAHAQENGVNFIDTADVYTRGASETLVGDLIRAQRHHWVLATKLGNPMTDAAPNTSRYSRPWVMRACEDSLRRPGHRPHRHLLPAPRLQRHEPGRAAARAGRAAARRQDPLLGRQQLPRLAHRRAGAHGAPDEHARAGGCASPTTTC